MNQLTLKLLEIKNKEKYLKAQKEGNRLITADFSSDTMKA